MNGSSRNISRQRQLLNWITSNTHNAWQAIILQLILAVAIAGVVVYAIGFQIVMGEPPLNALWRLIFLIILYVISRTRLYHASSIMIIVMLLFQQFVLLLPDVTITNPSGYIVTPIFAMPVALFLFRGSLQQVGLWGSGIVVIGSMLFWLSQDAMIDPVIGLMIIVVAFAMMIFFPIAQSMVDSADIPKELAGIPDFADLSPDMTLLVEQGNITYINPAGMRLLGIETADDVLNQPLSKYILEREDSTPTSESFMVRSGNLSEWTVQSIETLRRANGETLSLLVTVTQVEVKNTISNLITAKPMPQAIGASSSIIDGVDAILSVQKSGRILFTSAEFERLTGHSREEVYNRDYTQYQFVHPDDRDRVGEWVDAVFADTNTSKTIEYRLHRDSGNPIWVRSSGNHIRYLGESARLFTTVNIDEYHRKLSTDILTQLPLSYLLVKQTDDTLVIVDGKVNQLDTRLTDLESLQGQSLDAVLDGIPDNLPARLEKYPNNAEAYIDRARWHGEGEASIPVEWTVTPLANHSQADYIITLRPIAYEQRLEHDIERFQSIFNMMNDYAYMLRILPDDEYEFVWTSQAFNAMTGYDPTTESTQNILKRLYHPDDKAIIDAHFRTLRNGETTISEYRILTTDNHMRWIREYAYPVIEDGKATLIYGSVSDLTSTVIAEQTLKNYAMQQAVLAEIGMVAVENQLGIDEFAQQAINLVVQLMEVPWCVLFEYHQTENRFSLHTMVGERWEGEIEGKPDNPSTFLGYVLKQNAPIIIQDWETETRFQQPQSMIDFNIRSTCSVVVPMQDKSFGILNMHSVQPKHFTGDDINVLQMVANMIGAYIQQKELLSAEQEHHMVAEALSDIAAVLNSATELDDILLIILNFVAQIVPVVDSSNIMLLDAEGQVANLTTRHAVNPDIPPAPAGQVISLDDIPLFMQMVETGKPLVINDVSQDDRWHVLPETSWIRSYLAAPIFAGNECLGVVSLDSARPNAFTSEHVEQLEVFMHHASIAIQNARHAEELAHEVEIRTQQLQSERAQLQAFFHATGEGIFYSIDKDMLFVNHRFSEMMGYDKDELLGMSSFILRPDDLNDEEVAERDRITKELRTVGMSRAEIRFQRKDGTIFMGAVTASRVSVEGDKILAVTVVRDISQEIAMQEQRNDFISHASHELRNPISALNTRVYLMKKRENPTAEDVEKVEQIVDKMNALASGLLDISRFESGRIPLNLQSVIVQSVMTEVQDIQSPEAEAKDITLTFEMMDDPVTMVADELRLYQVVTNLVTNAIHYTPNGGDIQVSLDYASESHNYIVITVQDTGEGIPADKLPNLFQPFFQVHAKHASSGTGLGLSITEKIVRAHGGDISVTSEVGKGSCFIVKLPINGDATETFT